MKTGKTSYAIQVIGSNSTVKFGNGQTVSLNFDIVGAGTWSFSDANHYVLNVTTIVGEKITFEAYNDKAGDASIHFDNKNFQDSTYGELERDCRFFFQNGYQTQGTLDFYKQSEWLQSSS